MMRRATALIVILSLIVIDCEKSPGDERLEFFESKIRPVLVEHCYACHSAEGQQIEGGLRLDTRQAMLRGGESGPAVAPGNLEKSLLISAIKYESLEMPPDQKLPVDVIAHFEQWIEWGAIDPREESASPVEQVKSEIDFEQGRRFWSFQPAERADSPEHSMRDWSRNAIDDFIASGMEEHGLRPSPMATRQQLLRRLSFDLIGLPPTAEQMEQFDALEFEAGYSALVDSLLMSEGFGEHWTRMWLDLMRYADDQAHIVGNNSSLFFPNSYLYRDWVIAAFNRDLPYDRFIELQLAADLVTPDDRSDDVALGFIGLGPKYYQRNAPEVMSDEWEDRVDVLSRGLLGLTVACARCHDHKYDPIGTSDYYALAGVFASLEMFNRPLTADCETDDQGQAKDPAQAVHIVRDVKPRDLPVMIRGDVHRTGPVVPRGFLTVLSSGERAEFKSGSGREELARFIASEQNPLTARVFVNRVWARLIGKPLVGTPSNFGNLGERPTHPDLLDDLARRFVENGWSLKWLCREIVTSATYRQSSIADASGDPENVWLARMNRKRLSIEQWRDAILAASGKLETTVGGKNIDPQDPSVTRRTLYSEASRLKLHPMLALFDYPDPNVHSSRRAQTTSATQKLFLMNSPFMIENAKALSGEMKKQQRSVKGAVEAAYGRLYARRPTPIELEMATEFIGFGGENTEDYVHALMMANEMFFID